MSSFRLLYPASASPPLLFPFSFFYFLLSPSSSTFYSPLLSFPLVSASLPVMLFLYLTPPSSPAVLCFFCCSSMMNIWCFNMRHWAGVLKLLASRSPLPSTHHVLSPTRPLVLQLSQLQSSDLGGLSISCSTPPPLCSSCSLFSSCPSSFALSHPSIISHSEGHQLWLGMGTVLPDLVIETSKQLQEYKPKTSQQVTYHIM